MQHPLLYEINTRCWLRELSEKCGRRVLLGDVPEAEFKSWKSLGFTHIWLMGVWPTGSLARAKALGASLHPAYSEALPNWTNEDVAGSPYSVAEYRPAASLGGESGLRTFRRTLHEHGLKLLLDFVPNHLGLDHPWVQQRPELFVQSTVPLPEAFRVETAAGTRWLAHGKDPYFPAWADTVQLDYRLPATRLAMTKLLLEIAGCCDGVRCDMSMLLLNEVFARTWDRFPVAGPAPEDEFWVSAIRELRAVHSGFLLLAEAYWGLEQQLQAVGFDYTYDKELYDKLVSGDAEAVTRHLLRLSPAALSCGAHFLENHDEPRVAALLSLPRHRTAALLILGLPGMRFLHEGQLSGTRIRTPVQLVRRLPEPGEAAIKELYEQLLTGLKRSSVGRGAARVLTGESANSGCVFIQWQARPAEFDLVAVNLTAQKQHGRVICPWEQPCARDWEMTELLTPGEQRGEFRRFSNTVLDLELPEYGAQLLHFESIPTAHPPRRDFLR